MRSSRWQITALVICVAAGVVFVRWHSGSGSGSSWRPKAAAEYLDRREGQWANWPQTSRGQGTFCVSCHTALPYALARPALRAALAETAPSPEERRLVDDVTQRVRNWEGNRLYYADMAAQSRGTEAVLNALILANFDAENDQFTADTRAAFDHMWESQQKEGDGRGAWPWIQFDNEPWEAPDSPYYGACLAAAAVGMAPHDYRSEPAIQDNLRLLRDYLIRESAAQSPINRINLLWASTALPDLLSPGQEQSIIDEIVSKQRTDGGWSLSSLLGTWQRYDGTPLVRDSDGYATGLIVFVLEQTAVSPGNAHVKKGRSWLVQNQGIWEGQWLGHSANKRRHNPFSMVARFMDDAATAYAVLALTQESKSSSRTAVAQPEF